MDQHDALELLQPYPKDAVPKSGRAEVTKLEHERVSAVIAWPISTALGGYLIMLMTAFANWCFNSHPFDLSWPLFLWTTIIASIFIVPTTVDGYMELTRAINARLAASGDAMAAEGLLSDAVATWNSQAELVSADIAALTPKTTTEEREMLFDRAARLIEARRVIEDRLALLKKSMQPLALPPAEIRTYELYSWSADGWRKIGAGGTDSTGPK